MAQQATPSGSTQATFEQLATMEQATTPNPETHAELIDAAKEHAAETAAEHYPEIDLDMIEWTVSTRATKRVGGCKQKASGVEIRLTWGAYEKFGWEEFSETIRHELIHAYQFLTTGESGHGTSFKIEADKLGCEVHCRRFTEPKYWVYCTGDDCDVRAGRQKRSKTVKHPERYSCRQCGSEFASEKNPEHPDH